MKPTLLQRLQQVAGTLPAGVEGTRSVTHLNGKVLDLVGGGQSASRRAGGGSASRRGGGGSGSRRG